MVTTTGLHTWIPLSRTGPLGSYRTRPCPSGHCYGRYTHQAGVGRGPLPTPPPVPPSRLGCKGLAVEDANGNIETSDNATQVSLAFGKNPGGGVLSGGSAVTVVSGIATFWALSINIVGTG